MEELTKLQYSTDMSGIGNRLAAAYDPNKTWEPTKGGYGTQTLTGAVDLLSGLLMPQRDMTLQNAGGLSLDYAPTAFNEGMAQQELDAQMSYGRSKGSKIGSGIGTGLGVLLAPLTGGLSVGIGQQLGSVLGGEIGSAVNKSQATPEIEARRRAMNRLGIAYQDIKSEADINAQQQQQRMLSLLDYYNG